MNKNKMNSMSYFLLIILFIPLFSCSFENYYAFVDSKFGNNIGSFQQNISSAPIFKTIDYSFAKLKELINSTSIKINATLFINPGNYIVNESLNLDLSLNQGNIINIIINQFEGTENIALISGNNCNFINISDSILNINGLIFENFTSNIIEISSSTFNLMNCTFQNNDCKMESMIIFNSVDSTITNTIFDGNTLISNSTDSLALILVDRIGDLLKSFNLKNSTFSNNNCEMASIIIVKTIHFKIINNIFDGNNLTSNTINSFGLILAQADKIAKFNHSIQNCEFKKNKIISQSITSLLVLDGGKIFFSITK